MTEDPLGIMSGDINLDRYVGGDPLDWTDPMGWTRTPWWDGDEGGDSGGAGGCGCDDAQGNWGRCNRASTPGQPNAQDKATCVRGCKANRELNEKLCDPLWGNAKAACLAAVHALYGACILWCIRHG